MVIKNSVLTEDHKRKISEGNKRSWKYRVKRGHVSHRKGLSNIEEYGIERAQKIKDKFVASNKGKIAWNKGKKNVYSDKMLKKMSENKKLWYKTNVHPLKGKKHSLESKIRMHLSQQIRISQKDYVNAKKGKKCSEETKKKIRIARSKQIFPLKDSSIEVKIQQFLKKLGITFFTHQYIKDIKHVYQCDIFIPSLNLVIECDGDYWHKYPIGKDIDHVRTKELIDKGFKVLRLWEREIRIMDVNEFKKRLVG